MTSTATTRTSTWWTTEAEDETYSSGGLGYRGLGNGEIFDYVVSSGEEEAPTPTPPEEPISTPTPIPSTPPPAPDDSSELPLAIIGIGTLFAVVGIGALLTGGGLLAWWHRSGGSDGAALATTSTASRSSPTGGPRRSKIHSLGLRMPPTRGQPSGPPRLPGACDAFETARQAYQTALDRADAADDPRTDEIRTELREVETSLETATGRAATIDDLTIQLDQVTNLRTEAEGHLDTGQYRDALDTLEQAISECSAAGNCLADSDVPANALELDPAVLRTEL